MGKDKVKRILWERNYVQKFQEDLMANIIYGCKDEYLGVMNLNKVPNASDVLKYKPNYISAISKMFVSSIINFVFDKVIDDIIDIYEEVNNGKR